MKCQVCHEPTEQTNLVVYQKEKNTKSGYLAMGDNVSFDASEIAKFLYFCSKRGMRVKSRDIVDICLECLRQAHAGMN